MPTYMYKAMTKTGVIVRNRVESASKQNLIKSLKNNLVLSYIPPKCINNYTII